MENGVTHDNLTKNDVEVVVPLKHLSNFWRHLDIPLINCEVELILTWFKNWFKQLKLIMVLIHVFMK